MIVCCSSRRLACVLPLLLSAIAWSGAAPPPAPVVPSNPPTPEEVHRNTILFRAAKPGYGGFVGDPYPLDVCVVSDEPLGPDAVTVVLSEMTDPSQEGRQMRFCCAACVEKFKASPAQFTRKADAAIIERFKDRYPLDRCIVMVQDKLGDEDELIVYGNRLYRVCCRKCVINFSKSTARYVRVYETQLTIKQRGHYPLTTCVVTGAPLGDHPIDLVLVDRLVRVADEDAAKRFYEDPARYIRILDEAAAKTAAPAGG